jgi:hypothetical protein
MRAFGSLVGQSAGFFEARQHAASFRYSDGQLPRRKGRHWKGQFRMIGTGGRAPNAQPCFIGSVGQQFLTYMRLDPARSSNSDHRTR